MWEEPHQAAQGRAPAGPCSGPEVWAGGVVSGCPGAGGGRPDCGRLRGSQRFHVRAGQHQVRARQERSRRTLAALCPGALPACPAPAAPWPLLTSLS